MITGHATVAGTSALAERCAGLTFGPLGRTGLLVSQAGFGGYRVSTGVSPHAEALGQALQSGVNLIDTSANYADGGSEMLIGQVLAQLIASGRLRREEVVLVSKAGYLQGRNYAISQARKRRGQPFPDLVPYAEGLEHCIHPDFLEDQLSRSLARLGVEAIDVYLLHNPEYYLGWASKQGQLPDRALAEYLRRIESAFRHLETEVDKGRIRCYGISSNTFPVSSEDPQFTCLESILQTADRISPDHRFQVIQLPMNLFETGALLLANQPSGATCLETARQKELGVLINRPLNAIGAGGLVRLADVADQPRLPDDETRRRIAALRKSEKTFVGNILPELGLEAAVGSRLENQLLAAEALDISWNALQGYDHWRQVRDDMLLPRLHGAVAYLETLPADDRPTAEWRRSHARALEAAVQAINGYYAETARRRGEQIKTLLAAADPDWNGKAPLSQLAVRALRSTAGISCVLVGMRRQEYVADIVGELRTPVSIRDRKRAWHKLQASLSAIR